MRKLRIVFSIVLLVFMLFSQSQPAIAEPEAAHLIVHVTDATIPWAFPPPEGLSSFCPEIPEDVHINPDDNGSERVKLADIQKNRQEGTQQIVITDMITGTASDDSGTSYTFVYLNTSTYDFNGSKVKVTMLDYFELKGGDVNFTVTFDWRWAYKTSSLEVVKVKEAGELVDFGVDPFFFATSDGVNEDPNIIPGSWKQISTGGDPWNCDPL